MEGALCQEPARVGLFFRLLDILVAPNPGFIQASLETLEAAAQAGSLVVCEIVYAELVAHFEAQHVCDRFLEENEIRVEPLGRTACFLASRVTP